MTPAEYWDGDAALARDYRKAEEIREGRRNQELWLQGLYIYEAISDIAPTLHAFAKKGTKAKPYPAQPYPLNEKAKIKEQAQKEKAMYDKGRGYMAAMMGKIKRGSERDVHND